MIDNPYRRWLSSDNELCKPVIPGEALKAIPINVGVRVFQLRGAGTIPKVVLDLEHLQVVDYGAFDGLSSGQRRLIAALNVGSPIRPEEMIFLALNSLLQFVWPDPKSENDICYAANYHAVLTDVLVNQALDLTKQFSAPGALLPYWGRLAFLRVMVELPPENITRFGLDQVACTLVKKPKFNALTIALDDEHLICMNYALEPILKHMNIFLLHFFGTKEMAGPKRLMRAWAGILPTVLHFWSEIAATKLFQEPTFLYGDELAKVAHQLTADQLDFIVMHELGHVGLDHPRRLMTEKAGGHDVTVLRHEFEFGADAFALGLMRSRFMMSIQAAGDASAQEGAIGISARFSDSLHNYQRQLGAVYLLFTYMDFIQRAGELLRDRLDGRIPINERTDTHPRPAQRLERLELTNLGEYLYTSPLHRYTRELLHSVLDYAAGMDDAALLASVTTSTE